MMYSIAKDFKMEGIQYRYVPNLRMQDVGLNSVDTMKTMWNF